MEKPVIQHQMPPEQPKKAFYVQSRGMPGYMSMLALIIVFGVGAGLSLFYLSTQQAIASANQVAVAAVSNPQQPVHVNAFASTTLQAESAIVIDLSSNKVLYEKNSDTQLPLASLTKIPMAYVVSRVMPSDAVIKVPYDTAAAGGITQFMKGEEWHLQDIIDLTLVASSNDGADIVASAANDSIHSQYPQSPSDHATVWRMNDFARELHLANTYFINPTGLDESATQAGSYGSARDMAKLFAFVASTSPRTFAATTQEKVKRVSIDNRTAVAQNTDLALDSIPGVIMGKTGYTDLAGGNLVVVFDVEPSHPVVIAVMHSTEEGRFADMKTLVAATQKEFNIAQSTTTSMSVTHGIQ